MIRVAILGGGIGALGLAWAILAYRRMRFAQDIAAPGVVEVDEAQVGYLGPQGGGYVSIADLQEIRLLSLRGRRVWRLKQLDGQALLIPVDAEGADRLFDAFASLPEIDTAALVAALNPAAVPASSLPIRGDIDLTATNGCMQKGLAILENPENVLPSSEQTFTGDTQGQFEDLWVSFFNDSSISVEDAQARYVEIVANAD